MLTFANMLTFCVLVITIMLTFCVAILHYFVFTYMHAHSHLHLPGCGRLSIISQSADAITISDTSFGIKLYVFIGGLHLINTY